MARSDRVPAHPLALQPEEPAAEIDAASSGDIDDTLRAMLQRVGMTG